MELPTSLKENKGWIAVGVLFVAALWLFFSKPSLPGDPDAALDRIVRMERAKDIKGLTGALTDSNVSVACAASTALARVAGGQANEALRPLLSDERPELRSAVASALAATGDPSNVSSLADLLKNDKVPAVRASAANALGALNDWDGVEPLLAALNDADAEVRQASINMIEQYVGLKIPGFKANGPANPERKKAIDGIRKMLPRAHDAWTRFNAQKGSMK